jgi:hypothetical protein
MKGLGRRSTDIQVIRHIAHTVARNYVNSVLTPNQTPSSIANTNSFFGSGGLPYGTPVDSQDNPGFVGVAYGVSGTATNPTDIGRDKLAGVGGIYLYDDPSNSRVLAVPAAMNDPMCCYLL